MIERSRCAAPDPTLGDEALYRLGRLCIRHHRVVAASIVAVMENDDGPLSCCSRTTG
jgi:hypothetical protein